MNTSWEDYLRVIYTEFEKIKDKKEGIKSINISKRLNISRPSVCTMINTLIEKNYLRKEKYSKIHFTKKGLNKAMEITHNHRVIEVFLKKILKYEKISKLHTEAHRLEHAFSKESIQRLDKFLKNPTLSPSGKIIPH